MNAPHPFLRLIVVGVDGSEGATQALRWAADLAASVGTTVLAVHVLTYDRALIRDLTPDTMHTWRRDLEQELKITWAKPLVMASVEHRTLLVEADSPADGLTEVSQREGADLVVVGNKGHGSISGRMLGSTSYKLTHHARRPILVVPSDWRRPDETTRVAPIRRIE